MAITTLFVRTIVRKNLRQHIPHSIISIFII